MERFESLRQSFCGERLLIVARGLMLLQILLVSWLGSGTRTEFLLPMFYVSVFLFFACLFSGGLKSAGVYGKTLLFAVFYFIIVCIVQYLNPFAEFLEGERFSIVNNLPYIGWLPTSVLSSFEMGNSLRSMAILLAALLTVISACGLFKNSEFAQTALIWFVLNVSAMGSWAIYQKYCDIPAIYGYFYSATGFYGSFFLSNAAGCFLNMGIAASLGLVAVMFTHRGRYRFMGVVGFVLCALICSVSALYSESRASQLFCFATWGFFALGVSYKLLGKFNFIPLFRVFVLGAILLIIIGFVDTKFVDILKNNSKAESEMKVSFGGRTEMYKATIPLLLERPFWGNGGECSRYILPSVTLPKTNLKSGIPQAPDRPHSDILEYLLDFGIFGGLVLASCGIAWGYVLFRRRKYLGLENFIICMGAIICFCHGAFDMELHIPSTMIAFGLMTVWSYIDIRRI